MKQKIVIYITVLSILIGIMVGCTPISENNKDILNNYLAILNDIPDDLYLTIYYMDPTISTRMALSADDLINFSLDKVVVKSDDLRNNVNLLKKLDSAVIQPVTLKSYVNARMYYVLKNEKAEKILQVIISQVGGNIFVNGTEVVWNPVFLEVISPFLPEQARILFSGQERQGTVCVNPNKKLR